MFVLVFGNLVEFPNTKTGSWVLRSMKASKKPVQKHRPVDTHIGN
ncbi:hypothetical protein BCAH1134_C0363 (plasmid) [Bacillus cereus AH1134]|nr:hypothetical protein BCAH1134_C0363 [Bacillus cereus AH1134]